LYEQDRQALENDVKATYASEVDKLRIVLSRAPVEESDGNKPNLILAAYRRGAIRAIPLAEVLAQYQRG